MYLMSIAKASPGERVYVSGANLNTAQITELKGMYKDLTITNHTIKDIKIPLRRYMQYRITEVLLEVWHSGLNNVYIATNADVFLNRPINDLYSLMQTCDIALHFTKIHMEKKMIQNGVIAFKTDNPVVLEFLEYYDRTTKGSSLMKGADQRGLLRAYNNFKDRLAFGQIPHDYIDGYCRKGSHMWSAHLKGKWPGYQRFQYELDIPVSQEKPEWWIESCTMGGE